MDPRPFKLDKNELYIACHRPSKLSNGSYSGLIGVYELLRPQKHNMLTNMDWSFEPEIVDPNATNGYNSLEINGQSIDFNKLVQALCISRLRVNRLGYCYFRLREGVANTMEVYGFAFYRMNDMWNWSDYGINVDPKSDKLALMNWDRHDILHGGKLPLFPDSKEIESLQEKEKQNGNEVQRLKDQMTKLQAELEKEKKRGKEKEKEIQKLKEQRKKIEGELEKCQSKQCGALVKKSVKSTLFVIRRIPGNIKAIDNWGLLFENNQFERHLTPSHKAVSDEVAAAYKALVFRMDHGVTFATNDWYYIGVEELEKPILVYEGYAHRVEFAGFSVLSPMLSTVAFSYNCDGDNPPGQKWFDFGFTILAGYGPRLAIRMK